MALVIAPYDYPFYSNLEYFDQEEQCFEFWQMLHPIFELPTAHRNSNTHKMNHFIPIMNILIKKSNHQKIQGHAPSKFLHQA
jgi:hypothetical protein